VTGNTTLVGNLGVGTSHVTGTAFKIDSNETYLLDVNKSGVSRFKVKGDEGVIGINKSSLDATTVLDIQAPDNFRDHLITTRDDSGNVKFQVGKKGYLGISGEESSSVPLKINEPNNFTGNYIEVGAMINGIYKFSLNNSGTLIVVGLSETSDQRWKQNIQPLEGMLDQLDLIRGVSYDWIADSSQGTQIGVIAQEIEPVFPELVRTNQEGYKSVSYTKLTPILVQAVKELRDEKDQQINELKIIIETLSQRIELLEGQ